MYFLFDKRKNNYKKDVVKKKKGSMFAPANGKTVYGLGVSEVH